MGSQWGGPVSMANGFIMRDSVGGCCSKPDDCAKRTQQRAAAPSRTPRNGNLEISIKNMVTYRRRHCLRSLGKSSSCYNAFCIRSQKRSSTKRFRIAKLPLKLRCRGGIQGGSRNSLFRKAVVRGAPLHSCHCAGTPPNSGLGSRLLLTPVSPCGCIVTRTAQRRSTNSAARTAVPGDLWPNRSQRSPQ